ncbi:MAG: hypothetical protein AAFR21_16340 [Pseudomonadota bacterium]
MAESEAQAPQEITPAQSHEEIQRLLRDEIQGLKEILDAHFITVSEQVVTQEAAAPADPEELEALRRRHDVEITLVHKMYASLMHGPADGIATFDQQLEILRQSDLFDPSWYLQTYPDVTDSGMSPREHYVRAGAFEGRNPGPNFDTMSYYIANPDIAAMGWPALVHYAAYGKSEGRPLS